MVDICVTYGRIILVSLTAWMLQNVFQSFCVTAEKPGFGLVIMVSAGLTNIFEKFKDNPEGYLTKVRAAVVCSKSLSSLANKIGLGKYLFLGKGEEENGRTNPKILENAFEALLAAIYLDSNHSVETVSRFLMPIITEEIEAASKSEISFDYKTALQQFVQASGKDRLQYICVGESGPDHNKTFEVEAKLNSNVIGLGIGKTKREAEQQAAKKALELFGVK